MTDEELDRILGSDCDPEPSPMFVRNVLASVRVQADSAAPLKFPWVRFGAGIAASVGMAAGATVMMANSDMLSAPLPGSVPVVLYACATALISLGAAAIPRVLNKA